jgi:hypothetical protein
MKLELELSPDGELRCWYPSNTPLAGYKVDIPASVGGLELLLDILARRMEGKVKTASPGQPTQWEIEAKIKELKKKPKIVQGIDITQLGEEFDL